MPRIAAGRAGANHTSSTGRRQVSEQTIAAIQLKPQANPRQVLPRGLRRALPIAATLAAAALILELGFRVSPLPHWVLLLAQLPVVSLYVAGRFWEKRRTPQDRNVRRWLRVDALLMLGALGFVVIRYRGEQHPLLTIATAYVTAAEVVLAIRLSLSALRLNLALSRTQLPPTRVVALTFFALILLGTGALMLPRACAPELLARPGFQWLDHLLNCAFTATSATCVTGLIVYDTGTDFTVFGQVVILLLIQFGGLGIMTFGAIFGLLTKEQLSLRQSLVLQDAMSHPTLGQLGAMMRFIIGFTLIAELIGAVGMYPMWAHLDSFWDRCFHCVFHSVSAFCNAGFALQTDSLVSYSGTWQVYGLFVPLITLGGLGFPVLHEVWQWGRSRLVRERRRLPGISLTSLPPRPYRFSVHTKLVLLTSLVLVVVPTLGFFVLQRARMAASPAVVARAQTVGEMELPGESDGEASTGAIAGEALADPSSMSAPPPGAQAAGQQLLDALFLSITCRTAGFNTVDMGPDAMSPPTHLLATILMFIGGSPASTAGGIKTVGVAVLLLGVVATLRGRPQVEVFGRTIPETLVQRAAVIIFVMAVLTSVTTMALCYTEHVSLRVALFEAVSAGGTVGLSAGLTPSLTVAGRVIIMLTMFAGRLGPLTLLLALAGRRPPGRYSYPEEQVGIG
jgi:trk system potassium uptake protein TrkH